MVAHNMNGVEDVFDQLLGDIFSSEELRQFKRIAAAQIKYSIRRFVKDLRTLGFSEVFAEKTARQIVPKPFLYSAIVHYRTEDYPAIPNFPATSRGQREQAAFHDLQHDLLAPALIVYLFDQTIDDYNLGVKEDTVIERAIAWAGGYVEENPAYYLEQLGALLAYCESGAHERQLPESLIPYQILIPYTLRLLDAGVDAAEIMDILYAVSDVIVNEHLAAIAYDKGRFAEHTFRRGRDLVDDMFDVPGGHEDSAEHTAARAVLRNQGYLLISLVVFMQKRLNWAFNDAADTFDLFVEEDENWTSVRGLLQHTPFLVDLMRMYELIVRVGDDLGDVDLDSERGAMNWISAGREAFEELIALSGLGRALVGDDDRLVDGFVKMMERAIEIARDEEKGLKSHIEIIADWLDPLAKAIGRAMERHLRERSEAAQLSAAEEAQLRMLLAIMAEVVYGSVINARFNDKMAEQLGALLSG